MLAGSKALGQGADHSINHTWHLSSGVGCEREREGHPDPRDHLVSLNGIYFCKEEREALDCVCCGVLVHL